MMKSFFKKLAFVMALAMVVSLAAPAATTASAASNLKIAYQNGSAISEVNIAKVGGTEDLKFTGAPSNWKTLGVKWSSNNEAVATVDAAGVVTAMGAGTAVIAVQVGADQATVKVNVVDLPVYTATMGTTDNRNMTELTLDKVGAEFDLAFFGIKDYDKNRYNCNWYSVDENVATVDQKGLVKATGEGKTVISLGVYNVVTGKKHVVDSCTVVVGAAEPTKAPVDKDAFTVAQKDTDKFVLTFEEAKTVEQIKENLTVSVKINDQDFPISFENVTVDGKVASVVTYANFEDGEVYTLTYGKKDVEHKIVLGEITSAGAKYYTGKNPENVFAYVAEEEENDYVTFVPVLYDKFGNDITAKYDLNEFTFSYDVSGNVAPDCVYNDTFAFNNAGTATVNVTAAWVTNEGEPKEVTGKVAFQVLKRGTIGLTLVKSGILDTDGDADSDDINDVALKNDDKYTYISSPKESFQVDPNSALWSKASASVMYKADDTRDLVYTAVFKDNRGNLITTNDYYKFGEFIYESTNSDVLTVADRTGEVDINGTGRANVLVYYIPADGTDTKKLVASTMVTVTPQTYPVSYKLKQSLITKASHVIDEDLNNAEFQLQFFDQNGKVYYNADLKNLIRIEARDINNKVEATTPSWQSWNQAFAFSIDASAFQNDLGNNNSKTYHYKLTVDDAELTEKIKTPYVVFSVAVKNTSEECGIIADFLAGRDVPSNYKFNLSISNGNTVDVAVKNIVDYVATNASAKDKTNAWNTKLELKYLSTGNLDIAWVPTGMLKDINEDPANKLKTGDVGYVYYKVSKPSKTMVAGESEDNDAVSATPMHGKIEFDFNDATAPVAATTRDEKYLVVVDDATKKYDFREITEGEHVGGVYLIKADGSTTVLLKDQEAWEKVLYTALNETDTYKFKDWSQGGVDVKLNYVEETVNVPARPATFKYAATGNYTVSFYTTRKDNTAFNNIATKTIKVVNNQSEVKYLGLNPEFNGVTELTIPTGDYVAETHFAPLLDIVEEQLRFSYEDLFIGDYYEDLDAYGALYNVVLSQKQPKIHFADDGKSVTITALHFDVTVDDNGTDYTYTSVVKVNARIKAK